MQGMHHIVTTSRTVDDAALFSFMISRKVHPQQVPRKVACAQQLTIIDEAIGSLRPGLSGHHRSALPMILQHQQNLAEAFSCVSG